MASLYEIYLRHSTVTTDSRNVPEGSLFFALRGPSFDGNSYAVAALEKGAAYAVVDDMEVALVGDGAQLYADRLIEVDNVLEALQALAAVHRRALGIPVLAITGSNGKTTTKELVWRVLSCRYNVAVTRGNLNNHIGVPLTLLSIGRSAEFAVVEMGASSCGEIELLCAIAQPDFGIITNIGRAHLEGFGGVEGVKRGKGELFDFLTANNGLAFALEQSDELRDMVAGREGLKVQWYSVDVANGLRNHLVGDYNRFNIAAAVAIGRYFGVEQQEIAEAIESYMPDNNRSQRVVTQNNTLILDCYNANPSSMIVAIDNFGQESAVVRGQSSQDRVLTKAVVLGDMLELGEYSRQEHTNVLRGVVMAGIPEIYLVGSRFRQAAEDLALPTQYAVHTYADCQALCDEFSHTPLVEHLILIKGSHSIGLERLKELL